MKRKPRKYQITVNGQHNVSVLQPIEPHLYYVEAENEDNAKERASVLFRNSYPDVIHINIKKSKMQNVPAIVFLSVACLLGFVPWYNAYTTIYMKPTLISTMIAIALYSAVIIRIKGLHNSFRSASETILSCLTIIFCASFISLFIGDTDINLPIPLIPTITISGKILLFIAVLLSWLGIPAIARIIWIVIFILSVSKLILVDHVMGIWGMVYVLSAFLGIIFQLKNESKDFLNSLGSEMISIAAKTHNKIFYDYR